MENLKIGNTEFNVEKTVSMGKKSFIESHKGRVDFDLDNAWVRLEQLHAKNIKQEKNGTGKKEQKPTPESNSKKQPGKKKNKK